MKSTHKKPFILIAAFCVLAALVAMVYVCKQSLDQSYTNQKYRFKIDLMKDRFTVQQTSDDSGAEILFIDKEIQDHYPEWGGEVFKIVVYTKEKKPHSPFDVLDGPSYLGENEQYYYGYRMPTDVNYPPSESDVVGRYDELGRYVQEHALNSFTILDCK